MIDPKPDTHDNVDYAMQLLEFIYPVGLRNLRRKIVENYQILLADKDGNIPTAVPDEEIDKVIRSAATKLAEEGTDFRDFSHNSPDTIIDLILAKQVRELSNASPGSPQVILRPQWAESQVEIQKRAMAEIERQTNNILELLTSAQEAPQVYHNLAQQIQNASALRKALKGSLVERTEQIKDMLSIAIARVITKKPITARALDTEYPNVIEQQVRGQLEHMNQEIGEKHPELQKIFEQNSNEGTRLVQQVLREMKEAVLPTHSGAVRNAQQGLGNSSPSPKF